MTEFKTRPTLVMVAALATIAVGSVVIWNYLASFRGDILGFFRIGTVLPHSPYVNPSALILAKGELGYDGQLFLAIAMDPLLSNPRTIAALDNPRYRYRRILFPLLGYVLSLGQRTFVPYSLVLINAVGFVAIVTVVCRILWASKQSAWNALFVLAVPGYWCSLLLTTADLLAAAFLVLSLAAYFNKRYGFLALCYGFAALTHETMLIVIGSLAIPLLIRRNWKAAGLVLLASVPALLWITVVHWYIPAEGSTSGIAESFGLPGAGILAKLKTILSAPLSLKSIFDTSAFLLLLATFCLLIVSLCVDGHWHPAMPCVFAYVGFFLLSRMHILSYYLDFVRVFGNLVLLWLIASPYAQWPRVTKVVLAAWAVVSIAIVAAFSMKMI